MGWESIKIDLANMPRTETTTRGNYQRCERYLSNQLLSTETKNLSTGATKTIEYKNGLPESYRYQYPTGKDMIISRNKLGKYSLAYFTDCKGTTFHTRDGLSIGERFLNAGKYTAKEEKYLFPKICKFFGKYGKMFLRI